MTPPRIHTVTQLIQALADVGGSIFRGQGNSDWGLIPKVGRTQLSRHEADLMSVWRRRAYEFLENTQSLTNWDWLAVAQHHGLATRLLDWTRNPLAAAYFAVESDENVDGAVFSWRPPGIEHCHYSDSDSDPLTIEGISVFNPRRVVTRISRQSALFSCHGPANIDLFATPHGHNQPAKIVIDRDSRESIRQELETFGIDRSTLFPDLDGLSAYINWRLLR